jgi:hypothetical protein
MAWRIYQQRLNEHCETLSELFNPKDIVELSIKIEHFIKETGGFGGKSGLDFAREFLNGPVN